MPHHTGGRHRRRRTSPLSAGTLVGTALSASLVAGVALGTAAAAASDHHRRPAPAAATRPVDPAAPPAVDDETDTDLVLVTGARNAEAIRVKSRPVVTAKTVAAAWVDPNPTARVTSCFGQRWGRLHAGVDLAAPDGTPIVAAGAGIVVRAGVAEGYGNAVLIDHGNGYLTHYGHLSKITVTLGQQVAAGQQIGNEGSTGHSTGPHLHFEVHQGYYKNPIEPTGWMHQHGVDIPGCVPLD